MITSYATLIDELEDWLHRNDVEAAAKTAVQFFEAKWNRTQRAVDMQTRQTYALSGEYLALPTDMTAFRNIQLNTSPVRKLDIVPPSFIDEKYASNSTGVPEVVAIVGGQFQFAPVPDSAYTLEVEYFQKLASLSDANTTNWLLLLFPDLYFWGSLWAVLGYTMNDQRGATVKALAEQALDEFALYNEGKQWGTQVLQSRAG